MPSQPRANPLERFHQLIKLTSMTRTRSQHLPRLAPRRMPRRYWLVGPGNFSLRKARNWFHQSAGRKKLFNQRLFCHLPNLDPTPTGLNTPRLLLRSYSPINSRTNSGPTVSQRPPLLKNRTPSRRRNVAQARRPQAKACLCRTVNLSVRINRPFHRPRKRLHRPTMEHRQRRLSPRQRFQMPLILTFDQAAKWRHQQLLQIRSQLLNHCWVRRLRATFQKRSLQPLHYRRLPYSRAQTLRWP